MNYTSKQIESFNNKDKRIAWLSIFSSLCKLHEDKELMSEELREKSNRFTDDLFKKYPIPTETQSEETDIPMK